MSIEAPIIRGQSTVLDEASFAGRTYRFYRLDEIDLDVFCDNDDMMPYWADIWPSGVVLADLIANAGKMSDVRFLELGCGLGLPSMVAASIGADVTASDYIPEALDLLQRNAVLNFIGIQTCRLDWQHPVDIGRYDLVVAADVLYEHWQTDALVDMLARTVDRTGMAMVVDPDRLTAKTFADAATYSGFRVVRRKLEPVAALHQNGLAGEQAWRQPMSLYELMWRE